MASSQKPHFNDQHTFIIINITWMTAGAAGVLICNPENPCTRAFMIIAAALKALIIVCIQVIILNKKYSTKITQTQQIKAGTSMPCCTHTCTCIQWCEKWNGCFVPNIFSQRWWLDVRSSPTLSPSQRTGEQRDGSRGYIYTSFYFYLSQGGSWNHSEVPREAGETPSWSGNETWTALLLLRQEHRQGCLLCLVLADIADFVSLLCYFVFICILSRVTEAHTDVRVTVVSWVWYWIWMWRHQPSGPSFVCMVASLCIVLHIFDELCRTKMKDTTAS